jgi:hypothetical protein
MIAEVIVSQSEERNSPYQLDLRPPVSSRSLPNDYYRIVGQANGFVVRGGVFRFFGLEPCGRLPSVEQWNTSAWVREYGDLVRDLVFVAEDAFGDQYGFSYREEALHPIKFWCEGGEVERLACDSLEQWIVTTVLVSEPSAFDARLIRMAQQEQQRSPAAHEHLSFTLPLIAGGEYTVGNLEILDSQFHLHLLGQLSLRNRSLPEGARISRFWSES